MPYSNSERMVMGNFLHKEEAILANISGEIFVAKRFAPNERIGFIAFVGGVAELRHQAVHARVLAQNEARKTSDAARKDFGFDVAHQARGKAEALEFSIKRPADYLGIPLKSLRIRRDTLLAAIIRGNECIIPGGNDCVKLHDSVIAVTTKFGMQQFDDIFEE